MKWIIDIDEEDYKDIKRECSNKDVVPIGWVQILNGKPLQTEYEEIKAELKKYANHEVIAISGGEESGLDIAIGVLDKHIKELKNE